MFHTTRLLLLSSLAILVHSQAPPSPGAPAPGPAAPVITTPIPVGADGKYTIETDGLRAQFLPAGASLTNLFLKDMNGVERDIVVGRDTAAAAAADTKFTNIGGVVGRYTNRIKGGKFTYGGATTAVQAAPEGNWGNKAFTVAAHTRNSVTFKIEDAAGSQGFPGAVTSYVTYYVGNYRLYTTINGTSTENTPLMISQNIHWNLDGFANPETNSALTHSLNLPFSGLRIEVNDNLVPTGAIISNAPGSSNDFWTKFRQIGSGYDTAFLISREQFGPSTFLPLADGGLWWEASPVASLRSNWSGLQVDIYTDQDGIQLNACNSQDGTFPLKSTQVPDAKFAKTVAKNGCVILQPQDWIDGINNPAWMRGPRQFTGPNDPPFVYEAMYAFSVDPKPAAAAPVAAPATPAA